MCPLTLTWEYIKELMREQEQAIKKLDICKEMARSI